MHKDVGYGPGGKEKFVFYYMPHTFYRSIFDYYMESTYFDYDWENFFIHDIGLCEKNDRRRTKFDFTSEVCAAFIAKGINKQNAHYILSLKMTDDLIGKYFNSGYSTKQLFIILMGLLVEVDEAQLMQLEDPRCSFYSETLLTQFMRGVQAEETAQILGMQISDAEKENRIRALHGKETYQLAASYF